MKETAEKNLKLLDFVGIGLSVLCALHCTATPLLLLLPVLGGAFFQSDFFHLILFVMIVPIASFTFIRCYRLHRDKIVMILGTLALLALSAGLGADYFAEEFETPLTVLGSGLIILAHILNIRNCACLTRPGHGHCHIPHKEKKKVA